MLTSCGWFYGAVRCLAESERFTSVIGKRSNYRPIDGGVPTIDLWNRGS